MKKTLLRAALYVFSFVIFMGGIGFLGMLHTQKEFYEALRIEPVPSLEGVKIPAYDPHKPTVAVVLGDSSITTEDFDFLIPYELFAMTNAYNVFAVAPDKSVKSLSGGLDVIPHYSYRELDQLLGKSPEIIVVPFMPILNEKYQPTREWIQQHSRNSQTTFLSICGGSGNLADAGLLTGKSATSHWQAIGSLKRLYPDTQWEEDVRYVHQGNTLTSAGQTAGIDAVLHLISQQLGESVAAKVAKDIHYPTYELVANPQVDPYYPDLKFSTYILNSAFHWTKTKTGVLLYNDMDEIALSSIFDSYADTGTTQVLTISGTDAPLSTKHQLNIVPRHTITNAPNLDKMIVPGDDAKTLAAAEMELWKEHGADVETMLIHSDSPNRYVFEAPLEDLARQEDLFTAEHGVKRLEYRARNIKLQGKALPYETYAHLLLVAALSVFVAFWIDRRFIMKKAGFKTYPKRN
ncbi:DJ-1/PfpI family protein [Brevibacillus fulvus]|uniref:Transcriptional regulator GlxA family with amidase domain n=1 Tax=Brevibacillus fulvus TaxID=1125967 RepID=A0A938XXW7_9BACL|nr:DJ-1/PfpI family protein [Brevibacillus fulvus]MBM7589715.1 transcriptional regulator GlxA family with amidase domain [Brevibacillus fulvus]